MTTVVCVNSNNGDENQNGHLGRRASQAPKTQNRITQTMSIMKLTGIIILATCLQLSAKTDAQNKITLSMKNAPLEKVFKAIEKQSMNIVWCEKAFLQPTTYVSIEVSRAPLDLVLSMVLKDQPLKYTVIGNVIVISPKPEVKAVNRYPSETKDISGKVVNEKGEPLEGASIEIKESNIGTKTDKDGLFSLNQVSDNAILVVSFTGYSNKEVKVSEKKFISVVLSISMNPLDAIQVIAYGTISKRLNTGNVVTVDSRDIGDQPVSNPIAALEGRVPGMLIIQNTGMPGGAFYVQIRGQNSIANGNDPLYIIDGVPYTSQLLSGLYPTGTGGNSPMNFLNPADIESIDVLKDADATAIYGSRGASGVILITTKKGKNGKANIDININSGVGKITRKAHLLDTRQYLQMRHEAFANDGAVPQPWDVDLNGDWDTTRNTDWQKLLIGGIAHFTNAQASISGGTVNTQYLIGGGYYKETTVFPEVLPNVKSSIHFNITTITPNQKFRTTLSANYVVNSSKLLSKDLTSAAIILPPNAPEIHNPDGSLNWANSTWTNPFSFLLSKYKGYTDNLISNALVCYNILKSLQLKTSLGYTNTQTHEIATFPIASFDPASGIKTASSNFTDNVIRSWIVEPQLVYQTSIAKFNLNATVGTTIQKSESNGQSLSATGFSSDDILENIMAATQVTVNSATNVQYRYNALFGRLLGNFNEKYIVDLTARRDGSSRFGPGKQFANFGAIGAAWIFSNEERIQKLFPTLSFGKLRISYGATGNDQIGDYKFLDLYNSTRFPYQASQGLYPNSLYNPTFAWEVVKKREMAIELGFIKDRILLTASYYNNRSSNQLVEYLLPSITGFPFITANLPALVENKGIELTLNTVNIKSKNFTWSSTFNFTAYRNKLLAFPNLATSSYQYLYVIGQPLSIQKTFHSIGVNDTTGIYQFADSKGSPTYNPDYINDRTKLVNINPRFYGGFQNRFQFKKFQLDIFFQFVKQPTAPNYLLSQIYPPGSIGANQFIEVLNRWQKFGDNKPIQKFNQDYSLYSSFTNAQLSDMAYSDASFIRLKTLSFSYEIPETLCQKLHTKSWRIYAQGQNLLTFTRYKGIDPETQSTTTLPPLRVLTLGMQLIL